MSSPPGQSTTGMLVLGNQAWGAAAAPAAIPTDAIETWASGRCVMAGIVHGPFRDSRGSHESCMTTTASTVPACCTERLRLRGGWSCAAESRGRSRLQINATPPISTGADMGSCGAPAVAPVDEPADDEDGSGEAEGNVAGRGCGRPPPVPARRARSRLRGAMDPPPPPASPCAKFARTGDPCAPGRHTASAELGAAFLRSVFPGGR